MYWSILLILALIVIASSIDGSYAKDNNDTSLNVRQVPVNDWQIIVFEGNGWHRLHIVEVTITNESDYEETLYSQTTDRGKLQLWWIIPEDFISGEYLIHATDGIHEYQINQKLPI